MSLLLISSAPVIVILFYIYIRDKYEKEPADMLFLSVLLGIATCFLSLFIENFLSRFNPAYPESIHSAAYAAFVVAALTEEGLKFTVLMLFIWKNKNFNERFDGIVYAVFVSLGFAWLENILYVFNLGFSTGIIRAFTAVPAHAMFGISMGHYFGNAKFGNAYNLIFSFFIPFIMHGIYDFIIFSQNQNLLSLFIPYLVFLFIRAKKEIKQS